GGWGPKTGDTSMDKTALVASEIDEGREFLELADEAGFPVRAAMWKKEEFPGRWSLLLVTPLEDEIGPMKTYMRLLKILRKAPERTKIELDDLSPISPKSRFAKDLRRLFRKDKERSIGYTPIGDEFIEDGYLYFAK